MSEEWYNMVRRTDPETSKTAAKQEVQRTRRAKDRVLGDYHGSRWYFWYD